MIKKVRISMLLHIDDGRNIDLTDPNNWNVSLLDKDNDIVIFDVDLDRKGERSFNPKIIFLN